MKCSWLKAVLLLSLLFFLFTNVYVRAADDVDADVEEEEEEKEAFDAEEALPAACRTYFPNATDQSYPRFHVGTFSDAAIVYQNNNANPQAVILSVGFLQPKNNYATVLQNFSVVRQARMVPQKESVTVHYAINPDPYFEPGDYNLVLGLYMHDNVTNTTHFQVAFNSTVALLEPLGTDPRTVMTYLTLLALVGGAVYLLKDRLGFLKAVKAKPAATRRHVETGTDKSGYDPEYVSKEHHRFRQEELARRQSMSPKKKSN